MNFKEMFKNRKGQMFDGLSALGVGIATLTITLVVVFLILSNVKSNASVVADANSTAAVKTLTDSAATIPGWVPLVVIAVIGALLLSLVALFRGRQ